MTTMSVGSGKGYAASLVAALPYGLLGYQPYPGTLNVRASRGQPLLDLDGDPVEHDGARFWSVTINGHHGHVVRWKDDPRTDSYELVAPVSLRDTFGLKDRDRVDVQRR